MTDGISVFVVMHFLNEVSVIVSDFISKVNLCFIRISSIKFYKLHHIFVQYLQKEIRIRIYISSLQFRMLIHRHEMFFVAVKTWWLPVSWDCWFSKGLFHWNHSYQTKVGWMVWKLVYVFISVFYVYGECAQILKTKILVWFCSFTLYLEVVAECYWLIILFCTLLYGILCEFTRYLDLGMDVTVSKVVNAFLYLTSNIFISSLSSCS